MALEQTLRSGKTYQKSSGCGPTAIEPYQSTLERSLDRDVQVCEGGLSRSVRPAELSLTLADSEMGPDWPKTNRETPPRLDPESNGRAALHLRFSTLSEAGAVPPLSSRYHPSLYTGYVGINSVYSIHPLSDGLDFIGIQ
jgi:hypothetical protein